MHGARSSVDRVLASEARGRWFDPSRARHRLPPFLHRLRSTRALAAASLLACLILAGCATPPGGAPSPSRPRPLPPGADGPPPAGSDAPNPLDVPDAEPKLEPIRIGGPNKPYEVLGQSYTPLTTDDPLVERGLASWYGRKFHGRRTASGEVYNMHAMTAAHKTMPIPSYARVRNPANGREVVVRVNDRGPFHADRVIDLSYTAALKLGVLRGVAPVEVRRLTHDDIRSGRWRGETAVVAIAAPVAVAAADDEVPPAPTAAPPAAPTAALSGYWVQLGAFRQRQGAHDLRQQLARDLAWLEPWLAIIDDRSLFRLQAGPFATRSEAQGTAERIRDAAALQPVVLQRR
jgi:rare lipoprotein A